MFYTIISNQGMGISHNPVDAGERIQQEPVIELRSCFDLETAYTFACCYFMKRRQELGKFQPAPVPRMEEFLTQGKFFHYPDMSFPPNWCAANVQMARYFAYFSGTCFGILASHLMVASVLEKYPQPAIVLEVNSVTGAQQILLSQFHQMTGAISAYLLNPVHFPKDITLEADTLYPWPDIRLQPEGQQIWGNSMIQLLPSIDHTPKQVMSISSPKK